VPTNPPYTCRVPTNRIALAGILAGLAACSLAARRSEFVESLELKTLDWRARRMPASRPASDVVLLMLDQQSLDRFEKDGVYWPWPRSVYAPVVKFCRKGGARAVVFDVLFTSPSPYGRAEDEAFAASLKGKLPVVLAMETGKSGSPPPSAERFALAVDGDAADAAQARRSARLPVAAILPSVAALGDTSAAPDQDGVFRRVPLLSRLDGRFFPSLAAAAVLAVSSDKTAAAAPGGLRLAGRTVPLEDGKMLVRFRGPRAYPAYPLGRVVQSWESLSEGQAPSLDPSVLKDKLVLVGFSAPGLMDLRPSPVSPVSPGTEIVAAAAETILSEDFLRRGGAAAAALLILLAAAAGGLAARLPDVRAALGAAAASSAALAGLACLAFSRGLWLEMAAPQLALALAFGTSAAYGYAVEGRRKRQIQSAFSLYLAPEVVAEIAKDPEKLALGGKKSELTCYFSDIEGFTTISESLPPERLAYLMNRYLGEMTETVFDSGGTLDKYIGDAVMAFWGAPIPRPDHALVACKAALENQRKLVDLRIALEAEGFPPVRARIGLNSGTATVGNLGSARRFSYTALGDDINLASRLEGANKLYGSYILISESTRVLAGAAVEARELDCIKVKGKDKAVRVFELLGLAGQTPAGVLEKARAYEAALALYRARDFRGAAQAFAEQQNKFGPDDACELHLERCRAYMEAAPAEDWDGSAALTEK
jgi:adenylate cyclase